MDVRDAVRSHYSGDDLVAALQAALEARGVDPVHPTVEDLAVFDQLHAGFLPATRHALAALGLTSSSRLLDVGCGIGGAVRVAAADHGCQVVGTDLSPDFVAAAQDLTELVGLADRATFVVTDGERLPLDDASFDRALMIHVGMNVPDKDALFRDVHRVLAPGGLFAVYDQMRAGDGDLTYPLPWAVDEESSFVATQGQYRTGLVDAGFDVVTVEDRTAAVAGGPPPGPPGAPPSNPVFGPDFGLRIQNNIAATRAGLLGAVLMVARK
jgi:ubiquinone/menaquinone biosynthesis C-methylase UbiE